MPSILSPSGGLAGLVAFVRVAESGSFAEAARRLDQSPSSISKSISRLEERIGAKLLHRTTRSVSLTAEGERVFAQCSRLISEINTTEQMLTAERSNPAGNVRVSLSPLFGRSFLVPRLKKFFSKNPNVSIELRHDDRIVDLAREGVDVVMRVGKLADSTGLISRQLFSQSTVICGAPQYFEKCKRPHSLNDLHEHNCLMFRNPATGRLYPWFFETGSGQTAYESTGNLVINDGEAVIAAAVAGLGIVQMPAYVAAPLVESGRLELIEMEFSGQIQDYWVCYLERHLVPKSTRVFIDYLVEITRPLASIGF